MTQVFIVFITLTFVLAVLAGTAFLVWSGWSGWWFALALVVIGTVTDNLSKIYD